MKTSSLSVRFNQIHKLNLNNSIKNFSIGFNNTEIKNKSITKTNTNSLFSINYTSKFFIENIAVSRERKEDSKKINK
jgi:hypothetical protein